MSKSKGNLELVSRLRETGHDPMAIRLALLAHHYRSDWEWTDAELTSAEERLEAWRAAVARPSTPSADELVARLRERWPTTSMPPPHWPPSTPGRPTRDPTTSGGAAVAQAIDALLGVRL